MKFNVGMLAAGAVVSTTLRLPEDLLRETKIQAIRQGRSFNTHVAMILKDAAGVDLGGHAPAAQIERKSDQGATDHAAE